MNRIYMESCCFIDVVKYRLDRKRLISDLPVREEHIQYCMKMLEAAKFGDLRILTANLTISECKHLDGYVDDEVKRLFRSILSSGRIVRIVTDNIFIGETARDLLWEHDIHLGGADGTHVASALYSNCEEFITWDGRIMKQAEKIAKLGLRVISANQTKLLPRHYIEPPDEEQQTLQDRLFADPDESN